MRGQEKTTEEVMEALGLLDADTETTVYVAVCGQRVGVYSDKGDAAGAATRWGTGSRHDAFVSEAEVDGGLGQTVWP